MPYVKDEYSCTVNFTNAMVTTVPVNGQTARSVTLEAVELDQMNSHNVRNSV